MNLEEYKNYRLLDQLINTILNIPTDEQDQFIRDLDGWSRTQSVSVRQCLTTCIYYAHNGLPMPWQPGFKEKYDSWLDTWLTSPSGKNSPAVSSNK